MKTTLDPQSLLTASSQAPDSQHAQRASKSMKKSSQNFEAIFLQSVFKSMRKTVPDGKLFKKDNATEMFQDMLDQELSTKMSQKQSIGLADQIYRQLEKKVSPAK